MLGTVKLFTYSRLVFINCGGVQSGRPHVNRSHPRPFPGSPGQLAHSDYAKELVS
jgi:hypothetical protein